MAKKQVKTRAPVRNVSKPGGQTKGKPIAKAATNMELLVIVFLIAFAGGFGFYGALRAANTSGLSIGTAATQNSFGVGTWFRYDDYVAPGFTFSGQGATHYVITNITGITTAGDPINGDPMAASVLGASAKWYIWNISVYAKTTNVLVSSSVVSTLYAWNPFYQYLINGYKNRLSVTPANYVCTNQFNMTRPMFVNANAYISSGSSIRDSYFTGLDKSTASIFWYVYNKSAYIYSIPSTTFSVAVAYDIDTGILLWMWAYGRWFTLNGFSIKNPLASTMIPPSNPQISLVNTAPSDSTSTTNWGITITNHDLTANYEMYFLSSNQSVIKSEPKPTSGVAPIIFSTQTYNLNVLAVGTTTLSVYIRAVKFGLFSNYSIVTYLFSSKPNGIPSIVTIAPSAPTSVVVTRYDTFNGTAFLSWTASGGFPSTYQIWVYNTAGYGTMYPYYYAPGNYYNASTWSYYLAGTVSASMTKFTFVAPYGSKYIGNYLFYVVAVNGIGSSPYPYPAPQVYLANAGLKAVPTTTTLSVPGLSNLTTHYRVTLIWTAATNVSRYNIYRRYNSTFTSASVAERIGSVQAYSFGNPFTSSQDMLPPMYATTAYYAVAAINYIGSSPLSNVRSVSIPNTANYAASHPTTIPNAPSTTISPINSTNGTVSVKWSAPSWVTANGDPSYYRYHIWIFDQIGSPTSYSLTYKPPSGGANTTDNFHGSMVSTVSASMPMTYTFYNLLGTGIFCFGVTAENAKGNSSLPASFLGINITANAIITPPPTPSAPTVGIVNEELKSYVYISWSSVTNATSYSLYRSQGTDFTNVYRGELITTTSDLSYTDILPPLYQTTVYYAIMASNAFGSSDLSTSDSVVASFVVTKASSLTLTKVGDLAVSWNIIPNAVKYTIYIYNSSTRGQISLDANITSHDFNGYLPNGNWNIKVTVSTVGDDLESDPSNIVVLTVTNSTLSNLEYALESVPVTQPFDYTTLAIPIVVGIIVVIAVILIWNRRDKLFNKAPSTTTSASKTKTTKVTRPAV